MGTRADFYVGIKHPRWVGSIYRDGQPWNIPCKILVQINDVIYEETVVDFLMDKKAVIESQGHPWPWPWDDSQMTDYSYFFSHLEGEVYAYSMTEKIMFYPLRIMQGGDLVGAKINYMPNFPRMRKHKWTTLYQSCIKNTDSILTIETFR